MKLFEIPIYALTKEKLHERVEKHIVKLKNEHPDAPEETIKHVIELTTFPQRLWDYNHIVGYIVISKEDNDIVFDEYLPVETVQKYYWTSKQKRFIQNTGLVGTHFRISNMKTSEEIRNQIHEFLDERIKKLKKGYYVDREAFDAADALLDYSKLLKG